MKDFWKETKQEIKKDDRGKRDIMIRPRSIRWRYRDKMILADIEGCGSFVFSPWAETQLCNWLKIPTKYFRQCPGELKKAQVEYWLKNRIELNDIWLLRLKGKTVRAVLSRYYEPFDNKKIIKLWEKLGFAERLDCELAFDDTFFYLRALAASDLVHIDSVYRMLPGVYVRNSEVGRSSFSVGPSIFRSGFSNGLVVGTGLIPLFQQRHMWIKEETIEQNFTEAIIESLEMARETIVEMVKASAIPASEDDLLREMDAMEVPEQLRQTSINLFRETSDNSMLTVIDVVTYAARTLPPHERFKLETEVGWMLESVTRMS